MIDSSGLQEHVAASPPRSDKDSSQRNENPEEFDEKFVRPVHGVKVGGQPKMLPSSIY